MVYEVRLFAKKDEHDLREESLLGGMRNQRDAGVIVTVAGDVAHREHVDAIYNLLVQYELNAAQCEAGEGTRVS
ncbi:MAG TPA: hypothetical protein VEI97_19070 [bacterium]|nr:hypothetical protein [bacterium]